MKRSILSFVAVIFGILFFCETLYAQRETDEKAYLNFVDGVGFLAPDSAFGMNLRFRMQNRIGVTFEEGWDDSEFEATVKRCRLRFDGFIRQTKLTYYMQLSFSRGDQDWDNSYVPNVIRDAMVYYKFNKNFYMGFGQGKLPGNRQRVTSSGAQQFTDRSVVNSTFNIDRDFGVFGYYNNKIGNTFAYELKGSISTGDGRNIIKTDNGLAYTGRVEVLPFGKFSNKGDYFEGDIEREPKPKLSLAATYSYNAKATRSAGTRGTYLYEQRDIESIFADMMFKFNGWCFTTEYAVRNVDNPMTFNTAGDMLFVPTGSGINSQLSYIFPNKIEIAGRYSHIEPSSQMTGLNMPVQDIYTLGFTKYVCAHKTKLQLNFSRIFQQHNILPDEKKMWNAMVQIEIGI